MKVRVVSFFYRWHSDDTHEDFREWETREKGIIIPEEPLLYPEILCVGNIWSGSEKRIIFFELQDELPCGTLEYASSNTDWFCPCPLNRKDIEILGEEELDDGMVQCIRRFVDNMRHLRQAQDRLWELMY